MPNLTSITVNDRASTPVAHTFVPKDGGRTTGVAVLKETAAVAIGDRSFSFSRKDNSSYEKVRIVFKNPVLVTETVNGVDRYVVDRTSYVDVTFAFPVNATTQEKKDTVGMFPTPSHRLSPSWMTC